MFLAKLGTSDAAGAIRYLLAMWAKGGMPHFPRASIALLAHFLPGGYAPWSPPLSQTPSQRCQRPVWLRGFRVIRWFYFPHPAPLQDDSNSDVWVMFEDVQPKGSRCDGPKLQVDFPAQHTHTHTHPPRRFPLPPLSVSFLLLLKVQWLQTTKKRPLCRDVTAGIAGREVWEGRAAVPTDEPWHSPWANAGHFYSAEWSSHKALQPVKRQGRAFPSCTATLGAFSLLHHFEPMQLTMLPNKHLSRERAGGLVEM